jgi:3'-5' exoribonuclease
MKQTFVTDLVPGQTIDDIFVIVSKRLKNYTQGAFLSLVLGDRSGCANAVLWDNAEALDREIKEGDLVRVAGFVGAYNNAPQIRVDQVERRSRREVDIADFVETLADPESVERRLRQVLSTIEDPWLTKLVDAFFSDDAFLARVRISSAAQNWHHAFRGGLLKHTTELVELAACVAPNYPDVRRDFLLIGAFLHDIGKVYELDTDWTIDYSTIGRMLGHIVLGNQMALDRMREIPGFPAEHRMLVQHMILSHQGELEFASPVVPKTLEAILLHYLDDMNAKAEAFQRVIRETRDRGQEWSDYQRLIARQIWAGLPVPGVSPVPAILPGMESADPVGPAPVPNCGAPEGESAIFPPPESEPDPPAEASGELKPDLFQPERAADRNLT